jgi:hypothetical protein
MMSWLSILLAADLLGAGQRTHVEMGRRALDDYGVAVEQMLPGFREVFASDQAKSAYYAGCMFPDWGFGKINDQAAEDAHWKRFQDPYFTYLTEKCPYPWDEEDRVRVAFFFGIVCHGMTDLPWHFSKEGHPSLLERTWGNDRAGHTQTEFAYDLFLYRDGTPPGQLISKVNWPMEDIKEVYRRFGTILPAGQLETSLQRTHAMFNGGPLAAGLSAGSLQRSYPWVHQHVEDYYFGGVAHGGALTATWLRYYYARFRGIRYYQSLPTAVAEDKDDRVYAGTVDATLLANHPSNNSGGEPILEVGGREERRRSALVRFDISDWPADRPIARADLWLFVTNADEAQGSRVELRAFNQPWEEGIGATDDVAGVEGQSHNDGSATWGALQKVIHDRCQSQPIDQATVAGGANGCWIKWDVTKPATTWIRQPSENHGVLLTGDPSKESVVRIVSSEAFRTERGEFGGGTRIAERPILILWP